MVVLARLEPQLEREATGPPAGACEDTLSVFLSWVGWWAASGACFGASGAGADASGARAFVASGTRAFFDDDLPQLPKKPMLGKPYNSHSLTPN